jgi:hypothetical protein
MFFLGLGTNSNADEFGFSQGAPANGDLMSTSGSNGYVFDTRGTPGAYVYATSNNGNTWFPVCGPANDIQRISYTGGASASFSIASDSTGNILAFCDGSMDSTSVAVTLSSGTFDGQTLDISYGNNITTITYGGASQIGGITAAATGSKQRFVWDNNLSEWR